MLYIGLTQPFFYHIYSLSCFISLRYRQLGLDLVPRQEFSMVDPDEISVTELYKLVSAPHLFTQSFTCSIFMSCTVWRIAGAWQTQFCPAYSYSSLQKFKMRNVSGQDDICGMANQSGGSLLILFEGIFLICGLLES